MAEASAERLTGIELEIEQARADISRAGEALVARLRHDLDPGEQIRDHWLPFCVVAFGLGLVAGLLHDD
jgi:hypothetical protein